MSSDIALYLSKQMLWHALLISAPVIATAVIIGLLISIIQVVTQIQDSSFTFVPKILAAILMLMACSNWMMNSLIEFSQNLYLSIPKVVHS
ncbi:MAG: flagellar biosynthetic protein FliQ [Legionella sp.]|nr:MAG: flagellar biosynthetic protein FliQ [Legionella sp.]PJD96956.1 MAG: flagellar biosynthetic protein FliQ [Legionella sp.]